VPATERRAHARENISLPLVWIDGSSACTRDVSIGGLYVLVDSGAPVEAWVSVELVRQIGPHFRAFAQTLRVEPAGDRTGVAMRLHRPRIFALP
jgi:hypothetical protein